MSETGWKIEIVSGVEPGNRLRRMLVGEPGSRTRLLAVVVAVLAGASVADALVARPGAPLTTAATAATSSYASATDAVVASSVARSSAWFCAGASGIGGSALGTLLFTNPTSHAVRATVSAAAAGGPTRSVALTVPPDDQIGMVPAQVSPGPWVAATVLLDGGGVGVSQVVSGPLGWSTAPCASSAQPNWYFAHGSTASGASLSLSLYNPSVTDAVVDVTLDSSSAGPVEPPAYQGIAVPAGSLVVENVGDHLTSDPAVATVVSATSGTVVAAELQSTPGPSGGGGSSLLLGVPSPAPEWDFPEEIDPTGGSLVFHVFNPSAQTAFVTVKIGLADAEAEPLKLRVASHSDSDLTAESEVRIPTSGSYSLEFSSARGVGIVVDREISAPGSSEAPQVGQVHGVPGGIREVLLPAVVQPGSGAVSLAVSDVSSHPVKVTVEGATSRVALPGLVRRTVLPGRSLVASPQADPALGAEPLYVLASGPVAVELDAVPAGPLGAVVVPAMVLHCALCG